MSNDRTKEAGKKGIEDVKNKSAAVIIVSIMYGTFDRYVAKADVMVDMYVKKIK